VGKQTCGGGRAVSPPTDLAVCSHSRRDQITLPKCGAVFRKQRPERPPSTLKHRNGGVGSMVANHRGGGESSVVVTILLYSRKTV